MTNSNTDPSCKKVPHLRAWRRWLRLSQGDVERITGVCRETVTKAEQGKGVRRHVIKRLTRLGVTERELMYYPPEED